MTVDRIQWTCPVCKRRFAIPATAPTPTRCPQCRQAEEAAAARAPVLVEAVVETIERPSVERTSIERPNIERPSEVERRSPPISALAAIQLEVAEEASRGMPMVAPVARHASTSFKVLEAIATIYTVLAGLAVVGAFAGLIFGLRAAFVMEANQARTFAIFYALGEFGAGLIAALAFYAFREVIHLLLTIEENTRARHVD
jgi:hypothetical protein